MFQTMPSHEFCVVQIALSGRLDKPTPARWLPRPVSTDLWESEASNTPFRTDTVWTRGIQSGPVVYSLDPWYTVRTRHKLWSFSLYILYAWQREKC